METKTMWKCKSCNEILDEQFERCWNCGTYKDNDSVFVDKKEFTDLKTENQEMMDSSPQRSIIFRVIFSIIGFVIGYVLSPDIPILGGKLPLGDMLSRGSGYSGLGELFVPLAEKSFWFLFWGIVIGFIVGTLIDYQTSGGLEPNKINNDYSLQPDVNNFDDNITYEEEDFEENDDEEELNNGMRDENNELNNKQKINELFDKIMDQNEKPKKMVVEENQNSGFIKNTRDQTIDLKIGQTIEDVENMIGKPMNKINFGLKTIYIYKNVKIVFINNQLVNIE